MPILVRGRLVLTVSILVWLVCRSAQAQTAVIADAWWTYQQDCNGDGAMAGTLPNDRARLNWNPDVKDCNGGLTVFEIISYKACDATTWIPLFTNASHTITGCRSSDAQYVDVTFGNGGICRDYQIAIFRVGQRNPDQSYTGANDPDLFKHREQLLSQDFCLSDYFSTAANIRGTFGTRVDNNSNATRELGEPFHADTAGGRSLWYTWVATNNTPVTFDTSGSSFDTLLAVYTGDTVSNLTVVANNDDIAGATNRQSRVTFNPTPGIAYHIAVDGYGGSAGIVVLNWRQFGGALPDLIFWGPAVSPTIITRTFATNDCEVLEGCATPGVHTLLTFNSEIRNIGAGDLVVGNPATNSLFHFASCHGHYHFEEFAQYDLIDSQGRVAALGHKVGFCMVDDHAWSPTAGPAAKYNCAYQGIQSGWADVYVAGLPCQYLDITGVPPGDYVLRLTVNPAGLLPESDMANNTTEVPVAIAPSKCTSSPTNDDFANPTIVTSTPYTVIEFNQCATKQKNEQNHAGDPGGHSVWFSWTPSSNHTAVVTTKRSDFDTLLAVYKFNNLTGLSLIASNDDIVANVYRQSRVTFLAAAGANYRIAVDGYRDSVGTIVLNINPPANDDFDSAFVISGVTGITNGFSIGASKESYEPAHASDVGGHSIWYRWTAPMTGPVQFNTAGSDFNTILGVYIGDKVSSLVEVSSNDNDVGGVLTSRTEFNAVAGVTYRIAVDGFDAESGNVVLSWNMVTQMKISGLSPGKVQVSFTGVDWQRYCLEVSTNLTTWSTQANLTISGVPEPFIDTNAVGPRYYRVVRLP